MSKLIQVGILLCLGYAASTGCVSDPGPEYAQTEGEDATKSEEDTGESAQAICQNGSCYSCATWYTTAGKVASDYELTAPDANGFFAYSGSTSLGFTSRCIGAPMRREPGYLCPAQPDGSCAYNVGNGYGSISYVYPDHCPCNK